jgi:hypothetical protein
MRLMQQVMRLMQQVMRLMQQLLSAADMISPFQ